MAVFAACLMVLASCTSPTDDTRPSPASTLSTSMQTPSPAPRTSEPPATTPLVLAVHPTRPVKNVPLKAARALIRDGAEDWSQINQDGGRLRVVTSLGRVRRNPDALAVVPAGEVDPTVRALPVGHVHPLREPGKYLLRTAADAEPGAVVTVTVVGDIMLGRRVGDTMAAEDDYAAPFRPLGDRLAAADITVGNLESTLSQDGSPTQGGDSFAADPAVAEGLHLAGFDVLSLANNHVGDWGDQALRQTVSRVREMDIRPVGAGANRNAARKPVIVERAGVRIGFIATDSIGESPAATPTEPGTNRMNMPPRTPPFDEKALERITTDIADLRKRADTVIVIPHWGTQYTNVPEPDQRRVARAFAEAGADLVIGGHPHWVQGWERYGSTLVVHSLGNFIFDMDFMRETQEGIFLEIVTWDGVVKAVRPVPYVIGSDFSPRVADDDRAAAIFELMQETSEPPFSR